jgi:transposase InsO family protein
MLFTDYVELRLKTTMTNRIKWALPNHVLTVVWCDRRARKLAIVNMSKCLALNNSGKVPNDIIKRKKSPEIGKPKVFSFSEAENLFDFVYVDDGVKYFKLPKIIGEPESVVCKQKLSKWSSKRDKSLSTLGTLINQDAIEQYLLSNGHTALLKKRLEELREEYPTQNWSSQTTLTRYLNQYITFGMTENALLPFGLAHTGSNYHHNTDIKIIKRGRGGADNRNTRSIHSATRPLDKRLIKKISKLFGTTNRNGALNLIDVYVHYCLEVLRVQNVEIPAPEHDGKRDLSQFFPKIISLGAFRYHYEQLLPLLERLTLRYGVTRAKRDFVDRQGYAHKNAYGANDIVEIDSTELSVHIRDPRFGDKRLSGGRVFLCVAICVRTRYILGYSLSLSQPNWENVSECFYNCVEDKKEFCAKYGMHPLPGQWESHHRFNVARIDNGNEYPKEQMDAQLRHKSGFFKIEIVPKARGDFKAVVERFIGTVDRTAASQPGGLEASRDKTEQDASQKATLLMDDLHRVVIRAICHQNTYKNCAKLLDRDMAEAQVGVNPASLWSYSLEHQMTGGMPVSKQDLPSIRYSLLPKCHVVVKEDGVHFNGLIFSSSFAEDNKWFLEAKFAQEDIVKKMAYMPSRCNALFFEDANSDIHVFELLEQHEQYMDLSWALVAEYHKQLQTKQNELANQKLADRLAMTKANNEQSDAANRAISNIPKNDQTSYQAGTNDRRRELADQERLEKNRLIEDELRASSQTPVTQSDQNQNPPSFLEEEAVL